ncbi:alpha/beta fold hydrolase [uncultured Psychrobacter sp.]|uniref:alpha/beta fold hydrolase n=1 Tax=uncultured Psychrobacter sp. TaxID=259303 RepID=UPI003457691F
MLTETLKKLTTKDGAQVAVWKVSNSTDIRLNTKASSPTQQVAKSQNIFLTHGTFSDKRACLRIASYLAQLGHDCYIMEWRGHGASPKSTKKFNFETVATYDFAAVFRYLFDDLKLDNLHCVTHSGGGVCLTMFLIQNEQYIDKVNSMSLFACQAYGAISDVKSYAKISAANIFNRMLGYIPAKLLKLGPVNESYYMMAQWYDWNLNKNFNSSFTKKNNSKHCSHFDQTNSDERFDYRQAMPKITIPIYAISAKGDTFISPTQGCKLFFDNFSHPSNVFYEFSKANGNLSDYTHSRILMSRDAAKEIWPTVAAWINKHTK